MWAWGANTSEKKLRITSVLPIRLRGRPQSLADSLLPRKRSNRNLFFKERGTQCGDALSPPPHPVPFARAGLCAGAGHLLCLGMQCICLSAGGETRLSALQSFSSRNSCVSGASWSQRSKGTNVVSGLFSRFTS